MKRIPLLCAVLAVAACSADQSQQGQPAPQPAASTATRVAAQAPATAPAGAYTLDKAHASLVFRVNHLGFSNYTRRFKRFDAKLQFDPANLARSSVTASVDATSLETDYPSPEELDFNALLQNEQWLDAVKFPQMTFHSSSIEVTAPNTLRISGELTLRGVSRPMVLDATYNGGYEGHPMDPNARIGFSARGTLKRSDFGMTFGIPQPGTTMGVGDEVEVIIDAEFTGPPFNSAKAAGTQSR
jgi:polyisoprenoid-binding protein YceI